jgi:argininosuccinate lyase
MEDTPIADQPRVRPQARLGAHEGRLTGDYAEEAVAYFYKHRVDKQRHLFQPVMTYNRAHVVMLEEQGILDRPRAAELMKALREVEALGVDAIDFDYKLEGIYPNTEALVIDKIGYFVGGMLYLGRARGDAQRVPHHMVSRAMMLDVFDQLLEISRSALTLASANLETLMPCYTHLQHGQAMTFGFYMASVAEALEVERGRIVDLYGRLNMSPAEIGIGTTTSFPMNRQRVAALLGFDGVIDNALYAHRNVAHDIETMFTAAMVALALYRMCEDFLIWCSSDVGFMELDDSHSATSFMMAQKKNPIALHNMETSLFVAHSALLSLYEIGMRNTAEISVWAARGVSTCYESLESVLAATRLIRTMLPGISLHKDRMREAVGKHFAQATDLADTLVREGGISFREAHRVVGVLVRRCVERSIEPDSIDTDMLTAAAEEAIGKHVALSGESLRCALDPLEAVRTRRVFGGVSPSEVESAIGRKRAAIDEHARWLAERRASLEAADRELNAACDRLVA